MTKPTRAPLNLSVPADAGTEDEPFTATYIAINRAQYLQQITLQYAHKTPTVRDVRRMVELLRREADRLAARLGS